MKGIRQVRRRWGAGPEGSAEVAGGDEDGSASLVRSVAEPAAFEALVTMHSGVLHGYLARRVPGAADDLLAEVWLRAFAGRAGFDPARGTARAWLFGVARHVLAAHLRRAEPGTRPPVAGTDTHAAADPWHAVDERLDAAAVAPLIRRTLQDLPAGERELLLLVVWEQLTAAEAAAVVGIPPGTARSRLHRARGALRDALTAAVDPSPGTSPSLRGRTITPSGERS